MKKETGTLQTIGFVILVTLLTKVFGVVREVLQAGVFGTNAAFDIYTTSCNFTILIFTTVAYAVCVAAVPIISKQLAKSREEAFRSAGNLIVVSVIVSALLAALLSVILHLAPVAAWLGVDPADQAILRQYLQLCVATLPLIILIYLLVAVFQSMGHYALQGSLSLPYNLFLIVFLVMFAREGHVLEYVVAVCVAWFLQLAMTFPSAVKERFRLIPRLDLRDPDLALFGRTIVVTVFTTSIFLLCYLADSQSVTAFGGGSVSAVYYADKLFTPVSTTLIYSISAVLFPKYNQEYASAEEQEYKRYVGQSVENTLFVLLPLSVMFCVFAVPVVHVLFENGNFDAFSTEMTSQVFAMYSLGMAGFCVLDFINKAYYTMHRILPPLLINAVVLALDVSLNAAVGKTIGGIGMTTAIALTVGGLLALASFFRNAGGAFRWGKLVKNAVTAVLTGLLLAFCHLHFYDPSMGKLTILAAYLLLGVIGTAVYLAVSWLLGDRETVRLLAGHLRKRRDRS